jgi:hypothetical protein
MKKLFLSILFLSCIVVSYFSCNTPEKAEDPECGIENPLEDIQWLNSLIEQYENSTIPILISLYSYKEEDVILVSPCYGCPDAMSGVYNCQGDVLCKFGGIAGLNTCPDFGTKAIFKTVLFDNTIDDCNADNPLEDLLWLKAIKDVITMRMNSAGAQIIQYTYQGEYVFWIDECYNCPDALITVRNCLGEVICEFGGIDGRNTCPDYATEASDSTMLFDYVQH